MLTKLTELTELTGHFGVHRIITQEHKNEKLVLRILRASHLSAILVFENFRSVLGSGALE